tara:strand:- start:1060 stop:1767 length:708 start_codon:yes stop_codon:yes gene_type:complete
MKKLIPLVLLTTIVGCRVEIVTPPTGSVEWGEGNVCPPNSVCEITGNDLTGKYFTAVPNTGYESIGWTYNAFSDATTTDFQNFVATALSAQISPSFEQVFVSDSVVRKFDISASDWAVRAEYRDVITVPSGSNILSSKFTTSDDPNHGVTFKFEATGTTPVYLMNVWVSETPGGEPVSSVAFKDERSYLFNFPIRQKNTRRTTSLDTNTTYYFNMQNMDAASGASTYKRLIAKSG